MKRKALVILTVAILAFAMIPALGANAAEGEVKLVTLAELGNPAPDGGDSLFRGLDSLDDVSDAVIGRDLTSTRGTLFAVIQDNDGDSNGHKAISAAYSNLTISGQGSTTFTFDIGGTADAETPDTVLDSAGDNVLGDAIFIADANRNGRTEETDVTIYTGAATPANRILGTNVVGIGEKTVRILNAALIGVTNLTITAQTATRNTLWDPATGESWVNVRSTSGNAINLIAEETNLSTINAAHQAGLDDGRLTGAPDAQEVADADSKDSGIFVAAFGIIRSDWKDMLDEWNSDDSDDPLAPIGNQADVFSLDLTGNITTMADAVAVPPVAQVVTQTFTLTGAQSACDNGCVVDANRDGRIDKFDFDVEYNRVRLSRGVLTSYSYTDTGTAVTITVVITGLSLGLHDEDGLTTTPDVARDTVRVRFNSEPTGDTLLTEIRNRADSTIDAQTLHNAFDDLTTNDEGKAARDLAATLVAQATNLNIDTMDTGASILLNRLVGVSDGDELDIRYDDPTRGEGTQRESVDVDLVAPTIGDIDPANNQFTTDDDFDVAFTVTDTGSGVYEDAEEVVIGDENHVDATIVTSPIETEESNLSPEEDDDINDGYLYEVTVDVGDAAGAAEDDDLNLVITLTIVAYDIAGNRATKVTTITVDTIDPELVAAFTGYGVVSKTGIDRVKVDDALGAYVILENARDWVALVFNGAIAGDSIRASDIAVGAAQVTDIVWLNGSGGNVISIGEIAQSREATDLDFDAKTTTGNRADDVITSNAPAGFGLANNTRNQRAQHIMFLQLDAPLPTDATPRILIRGEDLSDLAGNRNSDDHLASAKDGLAPVFSVTVTDKLSNDSLDISISTTETLDRRPTATIELGDDAPISLDVDVASASSWIVSEDRVSLGLTRRDGGQDGVWAIAIQGTDEAGNTSSASVAKWELDTQANDGKDPVRGGAEAAAAKLEVETADVIFLSLTFEHEVDEYDDQTEGDARGKDSANATVITSVMIETLAADGTVVADSAREVASGLIQSSDGKRFVIALGKDAEDVAIAPIGSYQLDIEYSDTAGNTGEYDFKFAVIAQVAEEIVVSPGWSLISIPGRPQSVNIDDVLTDSKITDVWSLNNETNLWEFAQLDKVTGTFMGNLTQIVDGRSYFVRSTTFDPISVLVQRFNPQRTPPQYAVSAGWNSVGYTPAGEERDVSVDGYLSSLGTSGWGMIRMWNADETPPRYETYYSSGVATDGFTTDCDLRPGPGNCDGIAVVEAGRGYLLFATRNGVIGG